MVNKSFYQEFTDVFLTASNQEISLLLNPDPQSIEEYFENTNVLLKFYVIRYEEFKNLQIQFQEGKLNGSLPIEICKNEKFVLVWNGEPDIPNKIEKSEGGILDNKFNKAVQKLHDYFDKRNGSGLIFSEFFSFESH